MGGISPRYGIEQIYEGGIGSSTHSQSKQYLIKERFVPPTNIIGEYDFEISLNMI